jgi:hypothetical protein
MLDKPLNATEEFVYRICKKSFLSLWSYLNPQGKSRGKELCDILVVIDPDIIIISVKDVNLFSGNDQQSNFERWRKRAIEESVKQIYGAERWLKQASHVIRKDGALGIPLPNKESRRIHRIAVAFGGKGNAPIRYGNFGRGFVHVLDEVSFQAIFEELDTVEDFVTYLSDKEIFCTNGPKYINHGGEEDLLATYLIRGRLFPSVTGFLMLEDGIWKSLKGRKEYLAKREADKISYFWDGLIETVNKHILGGTLEFGTALSDAEVVVRIMARENRFNRRFLGKAYEDFIRNSRNHVVRSRMHTSLSGIVYVFLALPHGTDRKERVEELQLRCLVARGLNKDHHTVVGIATEEYKPNAGFSLDLVFFYKNEWNVEDQKIFDDVRSRLGYFVKPVITEIREEEYPSNG